MRKITIKEKDYLDLVQKEKDLEFAFQESLKQTKENSELHNSVHIFPQLSSALDAYINEGLVKHDIQAGSHFFPVITTKNVVLNGKRQLAAVVLLPEDFFENKSIGVETILGIFPTNDTQGADDPDDLKGLFHPAQ